MVDAVIARELSICLEQLHVDQQRRVLEFARNLSSPSLQGVRGADLLRFAGAIDDADLESMSHAIEEGCERVDVNEW